MAAAGGESPVSVVMFGMKRVLCCGTHPAGSVGAGGSAVQAMTMAQLAAHAQAHTHAPGLLLRAVEVQEAQQHLARAIVQLDHELAARAGLDAQVLARDQEHLAPQRHGATSSSASLPCQPTAGSQTRTTHGAGAQLPHCLKNVATRAAEACAGDRVEVHAMTLREIFVAIVRDRREAQR